MPQLDLPSFFSQIFFTFIILFLFYNILINYNIKALYTSLRIRYLFFNKKSITTLFKSFFFKLYNNFRDSWFQFKIIFYRNHSTYINYEMDNI